MEFLPFSKLTDVAIAPRVRNLLEGSYEILWREVCAGLQRCLDDFEREQFKLADRATNADQQTRLLGAMKEVRRKRGDIELSTRRGLQRSMLALIDPRLQEDAGSGSAPLGLSLVDNTELELALATSSMAAKAEMRCSSVLFGLAIRFAVIGGGAPLTHAQLPVGPAALLRAVLAAIRELDLEPPQRLDLLRQFEASALVRLGELLDAINRYLIESRVLPHLQVGPGRTRIAATAAATSTEAIETPALEAGAEAGGADAHPYAPSRTEHTPAPTPEAPAVASAEGVAYAAVPPDPESGNVLPFPGPTRRTGPLAAFAADEARQREDQELFGTLRELLAGRRAGEGASPSAEHPVAQQVSGTDVQSVLSVLQQQPSVPVMMGGRWVSRRMSHIKQDMLNQLRAISGGQAVRLSEEDSDTLDLVGMLFDHLLTDSQASGMAHGLITRLQVPLLKVALRDKGFFTRRAHPARQLLNAIAETSLYWVEDEDADRAMLEKMQSVVDRVCTEFDDDVQVFDHLLADFGRHAQTLQRKAEVSEKRHVDAARGRERLELARVQGVAAIETLVQGRLLPEIAERVLGDAWADLLALTILRQGEDSGAYRAQIDVAEELIACFDGRYRPHAREHFETLRLALGEGLGLVGFHSDEVERTLEGLAQALPAAMIGEVEIEVAPVPLPPTPEVQQATDLVREKTRATKEEKATILESLRKTERIPVTPKEAAMIERIKQLPFGTWFEFQINQQGNHVRRKLSWFSTVTGRCLFVNARGAKAEEKTLEQLARDLLRGNAQVVDEVNEGVIEKSWKAIVGKLKSWTGIGQSALVNAGT